MGALLNVNNLTYTYHTLDGETLALKDVCFNLNKGQFISIVGPSGCGKSTLLSLISGLLRPSRGQIIIDEVQIENQAHCIGYMFQKDHLFEWRNVYQNVLLGLEVAGFKTSETLTYVDSLLEKYGLMDFKYHKPSQLSGGMRQRAALIRTLALKPDILLLDEPFSALDYQTRLNVADDIHKILKSEGKTVILVTHDIAEAISMADIVLVLSKRPATNKASFEIKLSIEGRTPFRSRSAPEFGQYFNLIWKELEINETR